MVARAALAGQEHEAAGHIVSAVSKQREMDAGAELAFLFLFSEGPQPREPCCHIQDGSSLHS